MRVRAFLGAVVAMLFTFAVAVSSPLDDMAVAIANLGRYEAVFSLKLNGETIYGCRVYRVDGDKFRLDFEDQHILIDGDLRYRIDHKNREVVIERVDDKQEMQRMLIENPAKAFKSLGMVTNVKELERSDERIVLELTPKKIAKRSIERSVVEIDPTTDLPKHVQYFAVGDLVEVTIHSFANSPDSIEITYPNDYYVVDIR